MSHKRTVAYLDKLGEKHDAAVHSWRQSILKAKEVLPKVLLQVSTVFIKYVYAAHEGTVLYVNDA